MSDLDGAASLDVVASDASAVGDALELLRGPGAVVLRGGVAMSTLERFSAEIDALYEKVEALEREHGASGVGSRLGSHVRYAPSVAAVGIDAIGCWRDVLSAVDSLIFDVAEELVGPGALLDVDICWLRRQYPDSIRPEGQAPHAFHQDGAYGFDFVAHPEGGATLLPMLTAWIPLCAAGVDAPGLELVPAAIDRVLGLDELSVGCIDESWPVAERLRPVTEPGDVVLMASHHLHRTSVRQAMTRARTCVELRFVPNDRALAPLAGHAFVALPGP